VSCGQPFNVLLEGPSELSQVGKLFDSHRVVIVERWQSDFQLADRLPLGLAAAQIRPELMACDPE
jgi:hypothetical protein